MERFILKKLLDWKNSPYRKPLILKGVRQVGKTWILKEFGRRCYENTAYFNFDENEEYKQFFETTKDVDRILQNLMLASGQKILPEKTLIIFDEVQDCPKVINSMKYFCENAPQYHVACAGSLLGIALAKPSSFPVGKINFMQIDPMTFAEFLLANGCLLYTSRPNTATTARRCCTVCWTRAMRPMALPLIRPWPPICWTRREIGRAHV